MPWHDGMDWMNLIALRRTVAALMVLALSLAGMARGLASPADGAPPVIVIGGVVLSICHTDDGTGGQPGAPAHDCCDLCTLHAPVILPPASGLAQRVPLVRILAMAPAPARTPVPTRLRTPRLSQGPPAGARARVPFSRPLSTSLA